MAAESKSLIPEIATEGRRVSARTGDSVPSLSFDLGRSFQVGVVFALIMIAVWMPQGRFNTISSLLAALCIVWFTVRDGYSVRELGLARPRIRGGRDARFRSIDDRHDHRGWFADAFLWAGSTGALAKGLAICHLGVRAGIYFAVVLLRAAGIAYGQPSAVWGAALLFCIAHLPSPVLTLLSFIGGLLFCEMFRRYRNIFPLGLVHAALGLTIAASLPDSLLHHMRVGLGYLLYRA